MKKIILSIFNYTTILSSFIGAIGYGIGYALPSLYGLNIFICLICCLALGSLFDFIADTVLDKEIIRSSKRNRMILAASVYGTYLIAWIVVKILLNYDLDEDFFVDLLFVLIFQIISLIAHKLKKLYKNKKKK